MVTCRQAKGLKGESNCLIKFPFQDTSKHIVVIPGGKNKKVVEKYLTLPISERVTFTTKHFCSMIIPIVTDRD